MNVITSAMFLCTSVALYSTGHWIGGSVLLFVAIVDGSK